MCCGSLVEWERAVDDRLQAPAFHIRPNSLADLVGHHRLEFDRPRTERRASQRQPPPHDVDDRDLGRCSMLDRDRYVPAFLGEAGEIPRQIVAADHVYDHVDAGSIGYAMDLLD